MKIKALVVLSGGQDSVTCIGYALKNYSEVRAISFIYGQKHQVELRCAEKICEKHNIPHKIVDLSFLTRVVTSALISNGDVNQPHPYKLGLPASFVPNRNALFLTVAHAYAQEIKADFIVTGVCQTDYSGYPDCRLSFIHQMEQALNLGYQTNISIVTPLMFLTKGQTFQLAEDVNFLEDVIENSHTCYNGVRDTRWDWGYGCGECPACKLREKGYFDYKKQPASK